MKRRLIIDTVLLTLLLGLGAFMSNCGNVETTTPPSSSNLWSSNSADTTPPTVTSVNPLDGSTNAGVGEIISATFSEPISAGTVSANVTFVVSTGGTVVSGVASVINGNTAVFMPAIVLPDNTILRTLLSPNTVYNVAVTTGITDLAGNAMTANYAWSFTTSSAPDLTPPSVVTVSPTAGATNVPVNTVISALFSELLDSATVTTDSFLVSSASGTVAGTVTYNSTNGTAYFAPSALASNTTYTVTLTTTITDLASPPNTLATPYSWSFTTAPPPSITTPALPDATVSQASYSTSITYSGGVPPYTWSATGLPGGLSIDSNTGIISGPVTSTTGSYTVDVTVTDSELLSASQSFSLTVNPVPSILIPSPGSLPDATQSGDYNQSLLATGGTGTLSWTAVGYPSGLSVNPGTGLSSSLAGNVTDVTGSYNISLTVKDSNNVISSPVNVTLLVNAAPTITTATPISGIWTQGTYTTVQLLSSGGTGTIQWSSPDITSVVPAWLSLSSTGILSGTAPSPGSTAQYYFKLTVTDSNNASTTVPFEVDVP